MIFYGKTNTLMFTVTKVNNNIIELTNVTTQSGYDKFYEIYKEYQNELMLNSKTHWDITPKKEVIKNIESLRGQNKMSLIVYYNNIPVGLIVYQNVFWENIIYIEDIYIRPKFRRKKLATKVLENITSLCNKDTVIFLFILKHNDLGKSFWNGVSEELGWSETYDPRCTVISDDGKDMFNDCIKKVYRHG